MVGSSRSSTSTAEAELAAILAKSESQLEAVRTQLFQYERGAWPTPAVRYLGVTLTAVALLVWFVATNKLTADAAIKPPMNVLGSFMVRDSAQNELAFIGGDGAYRGLVLFAASHKGGRVAVGTAGGRAGAVTADDGGVVAVLGTDNKSGYMVLYGHGQLPAPPPLPLKGVQVTLAKTILQNLMIPDFLVSGDLGLLSAGVQAVAESVNSDAAQREKLDREREKKTKEAARPIASAPSSGSSGALHFAELSSLNGFVLYQKDGIVAAQMSNGADGGLLSIRRDDGGPGVSFGVEPPGRGTVRAYPSGVGPQMYPVPQVIKGR
jgi:hypothetical protein